MAAVIGHLGTTARKSGDLERAIALGEEALALFRDIGDTVGTAATLGELTLAALYKYDFDRATALAEECLALYRELGHKHGMAWGLATKLIRSRLAHEMRAVLTPATDHHQSKAPIARIVFVLPIWRFAWLPRS